MEWLDIILSLLALTLLEIVLGVDNLVFLSILSERLPSAQRKKARRWGLTVAWVTRLMLLASAVWMTRLTTPLFALFEISFSFRDLFLLVGGAFLLAKATQEIHREVAIRIEHPVERAPKKSAFGMIVFQIGVMDIIFSLDSVLTAVGLSNRYWVMVAAISVAILVMIYASEAVSHFIDKYPTLKMLALNFLMLVGVVLVADGFSFHIPRGYVYFAMGFSLSVECLNLLRQSKRKQ